MERAHVRTKQLRNLQRGFERSRLEEQLVAVAYELALPIRRQALPTTSQAQEDEAVKHQPLTTQGGVCA